MLTTRRLVWFGLLFIGLHAAAQSTKEVTGPAANPSSRGDAHARNLLTNLPLEFEANTGQSDPRVRFISRGSGLTSFLTDTENVIVLKRRAKSAQSREPLPVEEAVVRLKLDGARPPETFAGLEKSQGISNYFIGNDPSKWVTDVPHFQEIRASAIYPGIDLVYYGNGRQLEYDFRVRPGADPNQIRLLYSGTKAPAVDAQGNLILETPLGSLTQRKPVAYQEIDGKRREVKASYSVRGGKIRFNLGAWDRNRELIIDPILEYSTFLGGNGDDFGYGIAVDSAGEAFVTGSTSSSDFPTTSAFQALASGFQPAFVTKFNSTGTALIYSTYIGGGGSDQGAAIAVDNTGNAYITGSTSSNNFPTTSGAVQRNYGGGGDAFITKFSVNGNQIVYSSYLGGGNNDAGTGIALNGGQAFITGYTQSNDFPNSQNAFQRSKAGMTDAFVASFSNSGTSLVYSTFLGGDNNDQGAAIAVDSSGVAVVTGFTASSFNSSGKFPVTLGAYQTLFFDGLVDAFVTKLNSSGSALIYSTYLGGFGNDYGTAIALDASGAAYVTGYTQSNNFPVAGGGTPYTGGYDVFVTKLNSDGRGLAYSTLLPGGGNDTAYGIAVDSTGAAVVAGYTNSSNFPITDCAYQTTPRGGQAGFITKLSPGGPGVTYSTLFGGSGNDTIRAIALDSNGAAYVTGFTSSTDFPTTPGAYQPDHPRNIAAFVSKLNLKCAGLPTAITAVSGTPQSTVVGTAFSMPLTVKVTDAAGNAVSGVTVTFTVPGSGASAHLLSSTGITDSNGVASVLATANTIAGSYVVSASFTGASTSATFNLTNAAASAQSIAFVQQPANTAAGAAITPSVSASLKDANTNPISGAPVTLSVQGGAATLNGTVTQMTDATGTATFPGINITKAGSYRLQASGAGLTFLSSSFNITPGSSISIAPHAGGGQSAPAGGVFSAQLQASVQDSYQNPITGASVTFTAPAGGATVAFSGLPPVNTATVTTDANGIATAPQMTASSQAGAFQVTASTTGAATPAAFALSITGATANKLIFVQGPSNASAGATIVPPVTVQLEDSFGNPVRTAGVAVALQLNPAATLYGTLSKTTDANGVATFADLSVRLTGQYTLVSQSSGVTSAVSNSFRITAGAPASIQVAGGTPQSAAILTAFAQPLLATVTDFFGNLASGVTVNFAAPASGASATLSAATAVTDASGHASVTATANATAGSYLVTAATAGVTGGANFSLTNLASGAAHISFTQQPSNTPAGAHITPAVVVLVLDAGGNPTAGAIVAVSLQGGTAALGGTLTATTDAAGHATFSDLSVNTAGTYQLAAVSGSLSAVSSSFVINPSTASVLVSAIGGDGQSATVGLAYGSPLTALVVDAYQNPLAGLPVTFTAPVIGASVTFAGPATVISDFNGIATAPALTANTQSGAFQVSATVPGATAPAAFNLTNLPGSSHALAFVQQPVDSAAGATITPPVTVRLQDSFGNASPTPGLAVTLLLQAPMRQKSLSGTATQLTDANGVATFADLSVPLVGQYQLLAESTSIASATSTTFNIRAGAAAAIQATGGGSQSAAIATAFAQPLQATVTDTSGNPVSGVTVNFAAPGSGASATLSPSSAVTDASGHASVTAVANITAGSYAVTATASGVSASASFALTNTAGGASQISFVQEPTNAAAGASISPAVVVKLLDGGGNPVSGAAVTMSLAGGAASLGGTLTVTTGADGQATFSDLSITVSGTYQLVASSGSAANVSSAFTISATTASGAILAYSGSGQTAAAGALYSAPLQALVQDLYNNPIGGAQVTFTAPASSGASVTFSGSATVTTDVHGIATSPTMTANSVTGAFQVSATVAGAATPALFSLTNLPGSSRALAFVQQPVDSAAAAAITPAVTVRLQDSFGNASPTPGVPVTLQIEAPPHQQKALSGTTTQLTDANGLATFADLSVQTAGQYQLLAQSPGVASATSTPFTIRAGAAAMILATGGTSQNAAIGTAFAQPLQATVTDTSGNPVSGVTVNFAAPGSSASATLSAATAVTDATGHASVTATANTTAGSYLITATTAGVTGNASFSLTNMAGSASQMSFSQQPTNAIAGARITPPVVVLVADAGGNPTAGAVVTLSLQGATPLLAGTLTATTDAAGHATFSDLTVSTAGTYQLAAVSGSLSAISHSFVIAPSTASVLISVNGGDGQSATVGVLYGSPSAALVVDAYQNPLPGLAVTFTAPTNGASVTFAGSTTVATVTSDANGIATAPAMTANTQSGAFQVSASVQGAALPALFNLTNLPDSSHALAFVQQPVDSAAGAVITPPVTVRLQDSFGNASPTPGVPVTLLLQAPMRQKSLSGTATRFTDATGVATFADLSVPLVGQYQLLAESTGVASATSMTFNIRAGAAATILATGGTPQSAAIATAFPVPLVATVSDASGNPVSGVTVNFAAPASGASATLSPSSAVTDASGHASVNATANITAGSYAVTATASGVSGSASFALTNTASGASQISFVHQPTDAPAGAPITPAVVVKLLDGGGNPVSGAPVTMSLAGGTAALGGTLAVNTGANGQATFSDLSITKSGTYQLVASSGSASNVSAPFTIRATTSSGQILVYSGNGQTAAAGALYSAPLQALVKDLYQNPIGGATVTFTAPASGASVTFAGATTVTTVTTDVHGIATSPAMTANSVTGAFQVSAAVAGAAPVLFNLTNLPGSSHTLAFVQQPVDAAAGAAITPPVTVRLQDSFGNAAPTPGIPVTLQLQTLVQRQKSLSGTATQLTDATGVATFADLSVQAAGQYQLLAQSPSVASATSATFTIRAGAAASIQATSGTPQSTAILTGFAQPLQATVTDAAGNPVSGVTVNFAAPAAGASAVLSAATAVTDVSGHASVTATANATAGSYLATAATTGVTASANFALINLASAASQISFLQQPTNALAGARITPPVVVLVSDAGGNPTAGAVVTLSLQGATALLAGTLTATTDASGHATFSDLTVSTAGTYELAAVSGSLSTVSSSFVITPSTASVLISVNGGDGQSATVGLAYGSPLTASVVDAYQNPLPGLAVTFTPPTSGASVTFVGPATVTSDANGIATAPAMTANTQSGAFQVSATVQGAALPALFNLTNLPGSSHALAFVQQPVDSAAGAVITPPVTVRLQDSFGNASPTPGVPVTLLLQAPMRQKSLSGTATRFTDATGVATFADLSVPLVGQYQLLAESTGVASATSMTFNIRAGAAATILATGGTPQSAAIATAFPQPLQTTVTDASGNPVTGVTVNFAAPGSGASATLSPSSAVTDASGHASVTATANITAGNYVVTATAAGVSSSASFALTNTPSGGSQISFIQQPTNAPAGAAITPAVVVRLLDGGGNPVSGASVTMSLAGGAAALGGTLTVNTGADGQATFSDLSITKSGTYQLVATSGNASNVSAAFTIRATTSSGLILVYSGNGQTAAAGTLYSAPLQALVEDLYQNPIGGASVTFTAPANGASVTFGGSATVTTDAHGIATSPAMTANSVTGDFQVSAAVAGAAPVLFNLTNLPGSSHTLAFVQQPVDAAAGATITPPVTVRLQDSFGNASPTPGVPITLLLQAPTPGQKSALSGTTTRQTDTNGLATFADLSAQAAGQYQLLAQSPGAGSATSVTFTIRAGAAASIQATGGTPQSTAILTAFAQPLVATVTDASGNPVSGVTVNFAAPASAAAATLSSPSATTDANGHASVTATANSTAGNYLVTAAVTGVTSSASFALINMASGASQISFFQQPTNALAGAHITPPVVVLVSDAGGNPTSGAVVAVSLQGPTALLGGALTATTDASGHATFSDLSVNTAGTYQLAAVSGTLSTVSSGFTITPSTASAFISVNGGDGQSATVGLAYSALTALVVDAYQNPLPGLAVTFTAPASGASVTFAGATTVNTDANGIATAPAMTANTQSGAFQVSATVQGAASPALFNLTNLPGSSHALAFVQQPVDSAAGAVITPPVTVRLQDSFGNASPTPGVAVTLQLQAPMRQKSLSGTATRLTDANGVATFADLSVALVGQYQLLAESTGVASATSTTFNIRAGAAASIQATGGTPQSAAIATAFPTPLVATVSDASGNPVSGVTVNFAAPGSGASATLSPSFAVTDASGHASVTATANITAGSYAVTATASGVSTSASFALTNIASGASQISFVQPPTNAAAGASITPAVVVKLLDGGGNPVSGAPVTMSLAGGTAALGGTLTVTTGATGQATFSDLSITKSGTYQLVASSGSASNVSAPFTISATTASGAILVYSGNGQTAAAGALYSAPLQALVEDLYNNPIGGASVTFTAPASTGASVTFSGSATVTTDAHGIATSPAMTANSVTGDFQVSAAVAGAAPVLFNLTNLPGSSHALAFVQQPVDSAAGAVITPAVTVRLQDSFGNAAPTPGIPVTLQLQTLVQRQKSLSGTATQLTDATGLATFADLSVQAAGTYQLLAQSPSVASATSAIFNIRAGAAASIQATAGTPQSTAILTAFAQPLQATVTDASGNPVSGVTVNFAAPASGVSATLSAPSAVTDASGHASVTATANATAGSYLVMAAASGVSGANFALTNLASAASQISFTQNPTNALAGARITPPVVVRVSDAGGNPTAGAVVTLSLQGATALLAGTLTATTDASGHATFSDLTVSTAGAYQLAAVSGALSTVSSNFTITPSTASVLISVNGGDGASATVGLPYSSPLTALVVDAYQNPLAGLAVTFTPPTNGASVTFTGPATVTSDANGIATAPAMTANTQSGAFQVSATVQGAALPALFNLTNLPGSSHALAVVQQPVDSAAGAVITPPVTVRLQDSFGNASPTPGVPVTLLLQAPMRQKSLSGTATRFTDATGVATFADLSVSLVGQYQLLAESPGIASATSATFNIRAGAAASIQATGGTPQSAAIATAFPVPLVATVSDASGNPVSGVTVSFAAPGSGASATLSPSAAVTDASGHASVTATANVTAGSYVVTATAPGVSSSASFALTNTASGASQISFVQQPTDAPAGAAITPSVVVKLLDGGGNAVSGAAVTMSLAGATAALGGALTVTTGADGQATFSDLSITKSGTYQLVATSGGAANVSTAFTISATTASGLILVYSGNGQTAAAGALYSAPLQALVEDLYHNPIGGAQVIFTPPTSGASVTFSRSATVTTDAHGVATSPAMTANSITGAFQVSAAVAGAAPVLFNLTNLPGSSHTLAFVQQPVDSAAGATITPPVTVRLQDSFGNPAPTPGVPVTLQLQTLVQRQKSLSGTATQLTDATGLATFADLSVQAAGQYQLLAQSPGVASATSATFNIRAGVAASIQATGGTLQSTAILTAFAQPLVATVTDASGNPVSGVTVNFAAPASGAAATLSAASTVTDGSGHASVTATANATAGSYLVAATASGVSGANFALSNLASGASQIGFTQPPSNALAGARITPPVVVLVSDAGGNPTAGAVVAVSLQGPTALLGGTLTATTDSSGHATFSDLSVNTAGTYQLAAVSGSLSTVSSSFTITPSTASVLISVNGGDGQSATVGLAYSSPLTALVVDDYQNPLAGLAVTFTPPTSGASVTFTGPATVTSDANGIATAPAMTANTQSGAFQVSATVQGATSPALFNLTNLPGSSHALAFVQQPVDSAAGAIITPPVTVRLQDSFGNASPTSGVPVTLLLQAPMRQKSLSGNATRLTDANGVATFADLSVSLVGQYQLLAESPGIASATSTTFNIRAGAAASIQATEGTPQSAAIATAFPAPLLATVTDASGNPVSGVTVSFAAPGSGASATLSPSFAVTDASGHASVTATANITAGSYVVTATAPGVSASATFSLTNTASGASQISFVQQPTDAPAGASITPAVIVKLLDGGGNAVSGAPVTMSLAGAAAALGGTLTVTTGANGQATFSDLSITKSGTYQLVATNSNTSNVSAPFTIRATTASGLILAYSGSGQTATAGALYGAPLQALVEDLYHNPIGGAPVTFTAPASGASVTFAGPTAVTTDVHGIATSPAMTANSLAGAFQVSAAVPGAASPALFNLTNSEVSTIQQTLLKFIQQPTDALAAAPIAPPVTVQLEDASGNPVRTAGVPVTVQSSASAQSQHQFSGTTTQSTDANGLATFSDLSISLVGTYQLLATSNGLASATSQTFRITTGLASSIQATGGTPQSAIVQTAYGAPLQVTVTDASGNPVSGIPVVFSAPTQGPSGSFGGQTTVTTSTDSLGHAISVITANSVAGTFDVTASSTAIAGSALFVLTNLPAGNGSLAFVQQPSNGVVGQPIVPPVTVQVRDGSGNPLQASGIPVIVSLSSGTGALSGTEVQLTGTNGIATFNNLSFNEVGTKTLRAAAPQQAPADSQPFQIVTGGAANIAAFSGTPQAATVSQPFPVPLKARVTDTSGNTISGVPVVFAVAGASGPGGTFAGPATVPTDTLGIATAPPLTANGTAGSFVVTATAAGVASPAVFTLINLPSQSAEVIANPSTLTFASEINQPAPSAQTVQISADSTVTWQAASSDTWLTALPASGAGNGQITVTVNPAGLSAGTYTGTISITDSTGGVTPIFATYTVTSKPALVIAPSVLVFTSSTESIAPPAQTLTATSTSRTVAYSVSTQISAPAGGNWLQVSTTQGQTTGSVTVTANPAGLSDGVYDGAVIFTPTEQAVNSVAVPVTLIVGCGQGGCQVQPEIAAVVNGASFHPGGAPRAVMTVLGTNLSDAIYQATTYPLPTKLGPTSVTVNGVAAPLFYASPTQINFQMPGSLTGSVVDVVVNNQATASSRAVPASRPHASGLTAVAPGLFITGGNRAAALNADLSPHTPATPIPAGGSVILYITGEGPVTPALADGTPAPASPLSLISAPVQVTIGGQTAQVTFQGAAPGFVGLAQINAIVPSGLAPGDQPVFVSVGGVSGNTGLITVK